MATEAANILTHRRRSTIPKDNPKVQTIILLPKKNQKIFHIRTFILWELLHIIFVFHIINRFHYEKILFNISYCFCACVHFLVSRSWYRADVTMYYRGCFVCSKVFSRLRQDPKPLKLRPKAKSKWSHPDYTVTTWYYMENNDSSGDCNS